MSTDLSVITAGRLDRLEANLAEAAKLTRELAQNQSRDNERINGVIKDIEEAKTTRQRNFYVIVSAMLTVLCTVTGALVLRHFGV